MPEKHATGLDGLDGWMWELVAVWPACTAETDRSLRAPSGQRGPEALVPNRGFELDQAMSGPEEPAREIS